MSHRNPTDAVGGTFIRGLQGARFRGNPTDAVGGTFIRGLQEQTRPNLVLMDINLPELDGLGATRRILENEALRDVPVVVVTAFGTEGFQRAAYDAGASGYLTKPIDLDRMTQLVARLLSPEGSGSLVK